MKLKQIYDVSNNQLIINLPEGFKDKKRVLVIVDDDIDETTGKLLFLKQAGTDPLFLADIQAIKEDFDFIDSRGNNMIVKRWGIYRANLEPVIGSEQGKSRPVLIISDDNINALLNIVNVLPLTTRKPGRQIYPNEVLLVENEYGLPNESIILCHQIRTLDKQRLSLEYGQITSNSKQTEVLNALCFQLGIQMDTYS